MLLAVGVISAFPARWSALFQLPVGPILDRLYPLFGHRGPFQSGSLPFLTTADLASSWQKALRAWVPHARVVFDRFHVERLAADAVDEVRRSEQRRLASEPEDAKALKGTRYALLKHPARLRPGEARRLETLRRENRGWTGPTN